MNITIYTKANCIACTATKKQLSKLGVEFKEVNILHPSVDLEKFKNQGLMSAPVVEVTDNGEVVDIWAGLDLVKIKNTTKVSA